ncbi:ABC transporter permease [Microbacterium sp. RURRCA19A]|uniref:ABC transporter permease n=1 Tax=Microbacterium sp. RURRCA19A TaxID=1907391 RepID=UPI0020C9930C|nr:FtsX-like permease family protein [Microbacterium sp. RURRCA19A]
MALITAVAVAVSVLVVTLGLATSTKAQVSSAFDAQANREVSATWQSQGVNFSPEEAVVRAQGVAGVESVAALSDRGEALVTVTGQARATTVHGVVGDVVSATRSEVVWAEGTHHRLESGEAMLGESLASQLGLSGLRTSPTISISGKFFGVVGLVRSSDRYPRLAGEVLLAESDARIAGPGGEVSLAITTRPASAQQVGSQIAVAVNPFAPDGLAVSVPVDPIGLRQEVEGGVQSVLQAFTAIAGAIGLVTLSAAIASSVRGRRSEFGLRRAVGAQTGQLARLVGLEAATVGILGGVAGLLIGMIAVLLFTIGNRWVPVFDPAMAPVAVLSGLALALMSSVAGARRAARVQPSLALRL